MELEWHWVLFQVIIGSEIWRFLHRSYAHSISFEKHLHCTEIIYVNLLNIGVVGWVWKPQSCQGIQSRLLTHSWKCLRLWKFHRLKHACHGIEIHWIWLWHSNLTWNLWFRFSRLAHHFHYWSSGRCSIKHVHIVCSKHHLHRAEISHVKWWGSLRWWSLCGCRRA